MAAEKLRRRVSTRSGTISVSLEQKLEDILVVSYNDGAAIFRGVLMNTTKQNVPCGIYPPPIQPAGPSSSQKIKASIDVDPEEDKLAMVSHRMSYFWSTSGGESLENLMKSSEATGRKFNLRRTITLPAKYRDARGGRLGVRLRPRNVLCSKCRSVCNETSLNVTANGRANSSNKLPSPTTRSTRNSTPAEPSSTSNLRNFRTKPCSVSLPLLRTADPVSVASQKESVDGSVKSSAPKRSAKKLDFAKFHPVPVTCVSNVAEKPGNANGTTVMSDRAAGDACSRRSKRKKASVGSMEDLWDENDFECGTSPISPKKNASTAPRVDDPSAESTSKRSNTVIKISIGSNGQHVLKIPKKQLMVCGEPSSDEECSQESDEKHLVDFADFPSSSDTNRVHRSKRKKKKNKSSRDDEKRKNRKLARLAERAYELGFVEPDRDPLALDVPDREEDSIGVDDYKVTRNSAAAVFVVSNSASSDDVGSGSFRGERFIESTPEVFIRGLDVVS